MEVAEQITQELGLKNKAVVNTLALFAEGCTIPFIARYRKEKTGNLDEVQIESIAKTHARILQVKERREAILKSLKEMGSLTEKLESQLLNASTLSELEDIYLPYKPKRKTKASQAIELGLEPLAKIFMAQNQTNYEASIESHSRTCGIDKAEAISGAIDIITEWISHNMVARKITRSAFDSAVISSKLVKGKDREESEKFKDYFSFSESVKRCRSHRFLALMRGQALGVLKVSIVPDTKEIPKALQRFFLKNGGNEFVERALNNAYSKYLVPSIENEVTAAFKTKADEEAIKVFATNLEQLLMAAPLGGKRILAIDPGFRTGCKLVCLDAKGDLVHNETIYPHPPKGKSGPAKAKINSLVNQYKIEAIAVGNGTAGRETEHLIKQIRFERDVEVYIVNESGASIYSASTVAREEFPNYDVTVRGAVSIGRRLMDPLAELVKIEPKAIGVGQYQHDVNQNLMDTSLNQVVENCVNKVGVNVNTASKELLSYVSGLGPQLAQNIIAFRTENDGITSRKQLMKVPRMGAKSFEQCAGFLRIPEGENPLDNSNIHPENYALVEKLAKKNKLNIAELIGNEEKIEVLKTELAELKLGEFTTNDILNELKKPGRDPRKKAKLFEFKKGIHKIEQLEMGMVLPGIVTNITNFGAFVDIGVKQDGLVHISNIKNDYVSNPMDELKLHQQVEVKIIGLEVDRKRINLSMKDV